MRCKILHYRPKIHAFVECHNSKYISNSKVKTKYCYFEEALWAVNVCLLK